MGYTHSVGILQRNVVSVDPDLLFGKIAVKNNLLTELLVDECLGLQKSLEAGGTTRSLGEIMLEKKYLTREEIRAILELQNKYIARSNDILYGKIAIKNGLVTRERIVECLEYQRAQAPNDRIGEILVNRRFISFRDHCAILKAQTRLRAGQPA